MHCLISCQRIFPDTYKNTNARHALSHDLPKVGITDPGSFAMLQFGQVGIGTTQDSVATPQLIAALQNDRISQFACGWRHTLALTEQGQMYSWGRGVSGQLGHAGTRDL